MNGGNTGSDLLCPKIQKQVNNRQRYKKRNGECKI